MRTGAKRELKLKIQTCGNVLSINKQLVKCEVIGSMLSAMRELSTLCHMHDKALMRTILAPTVHYANFLPASTQLDSESMVRIRLESFLYVQVSVFWYMHAGVCESIIFVSFFASFLRFRDVM